MTLTDPAVRAAHAGLQATLERMGLRLDAMQIKETSHHTQVMVFRASRGQQQAIAAYCRRHGLTNQAEGLRRLVMLGLESTS